MGDIGDKEDYNHSRNVLSVKQVKCMGNFLPMLVIIALQDLCNKLSDSEAVVQLIFELKGSFQETLNFLALLERQYKRPSKETAKPLKQLFQHRKSTFKNVLSTKNINEISDFLHSLTCKGTQNFDGEIQNNNDVGESPDSISQDASGRDLQDKKFTIENIQEKESEEGKQEDSVEIGDHEKKTFQQLKYTNQSSGKIRSLKARISDERDLIDQSIVKNKGKDDGVNKLPEIYHTIRVEDEEIDALKCEKCKFRIQEIISLRKKVETLENEKEEILAELGEIIVEKNVKENDDKKSANFQRLYRSSSPDSQKSGVPPCCTKPATEVNRLGYPNDSHGHVCGSATTFDKISDRPENVMVVFRVHKERSFHCDICGVCLDVNLRGNHKCREGSAHDKCIFCQEDAFTGCQILPCSHKVHKECANQMMRQGRTQCTCGQNFSPKMMKTGKKN